MMRSEDNRAACHDFLSATLTRETEARAFLDALQSEPNEEMVFQVARLLVLGDSSKDAPTVFLTSAARHDLHSVLDVVVIKAALQERKGILKDELGQKVDALVERVHAVLDQMKQLESQP